MTTQLAVVPSGPHNVDITGIEQVLVMGDLSSLDEAQRLQYYQATCASLGLNPLTRPFDYVKFEQGGLRLYPNKGAAEQLRALRRISLRVIHRETAHGVHTVVVQATDPSGRTDESAGVISVENLRGPALATAMMKAETKAKRRATLSICGLIALDETDQGERDLPAGATVVLDVDVNTGEVTETAHPSRYQPPRPEALPARDAQGQQCVNDRGLPIWDIDGVTFTLYQPGNGRRASLLSEGGCPMHALPMFAPLTGTVRWGHRTPEGVCWLDEARQALRALEEARAGQAVLAEEMAESSYLDEEEAPAVAEQAPFVLSSAPA